MSYIFQNDDGNYCAAFIDSLDTLRSQGRITSPRGQKTKELDHVVFKVDPKKTLYTSPIRKLNFFFLIAENLWYWSGRNSTELPSSYVKNYRQFSDNGIHQGAYGPMLLEQIRFIINTLKSDPDSRQAVLTLWRPNPSEAKDKPCTLAFDFKIRDGKLNMHVTMRSNDAIWGNNYDVPSFSLLQIAIAGILGVSTGFLYLTAHSYHVYERHFRLMDQLIFENWNYNYYPKELEMIPNKISSLDEHMLSIEELLMCHYSIMSGHKINFENLNDFYSQFVSMMMLFENKKDFTHIKKLRNIGSPFGTIYYEHYFNKK